MVKTETARAASRDFGHGAPNKKANQLLPTGSSGGFRLASEMPVKGLFACDDRSWANPTDRESLLFDQVENFVFGQTQKRSDGCNAPNKVIT
jgi:hypothetical protein